jgi:hypothetical protein
MSAPRGIARACAIAAAVGIGLLASCGKAGKPVVPPRENLTSKVEAVFPAGRSVGVLYDTEIWVRFSEALDPATVDERTVFLKLDTVRIPTTITYDPLTRTIRLVPRVPLALLRTHTVEITPVVATADGQPLGQTYFWQFKTNGLRRPIPFAPLLGARNESPFTVLRWAFTEASAGVIRYDIYSGTDSAAVAARGLVRVSSEAHAYFLPAVRWPLGTVLYWAVTAINVTTGERLDGPVWRYETLPVGTPIDSVIVPPADWGYYCSVCSNRLICNSSVFASGPSYNDGIHWRLKETVGGRRLAGAQLVMNANTGGDLTSYRSEVHQTTGPWSPCAYATAPTPEQGIELAFAVQEMGTSRLTYQGDRFTAHLEAVARYDFLYGYALVSQKNLGYSGPSSLEGSSRLKIYYYRTPTEPAAAAAPPHGSGAPAP